MNAFRQIRILAVDDEQSVLHSIARCLLDTPYELLTAFSGAQALELLEQHGPVDLIISDFRMPGMNGVELLQRVMAGWPATRRMILSAYTDADIVLAAVNEGRVHRFLTKPWKNDVLLATIRELLAEVDALTTVKQEVEELVRRNQVLASTNDQLQNLLNDLLSAVRVENTAKREQQQSVDRFAGELAALQLLSERERQIMVCMSQGKRPKEIADGLGISIKTVSTYKVRMYEKMGFHNDAELISCAIRHKLG